MAVGKTTAIRYLQEHAPYINISYEDNTDVIEEVKRRGLDKNKYPDYLEIQKLWLHKEVVRHQKAVEYPCSIMDFGAENALKKELSEVRECLPDRILFLDAADEVLRLHKQNDTTRSRNFFEHHLQYMMPLKRAWFIGRENVDVLRVDDLSPEEVGQKVKQWCDECMRS